MKKQIKILIGVVAIIVVIIAIVMVVAVGRNTSDEKEEQENNQPHNVINDVVDFKSEIDMTDLSNCEIREDGMKVNNSPKIAGEREFNYTKITGITIESTGDMAVFNAQVINELEKDIEGYIIYISFLKKDGSVIDKVETFYPDIASGETGLITATTPKDIATAYDIKIERQMQ